MKSPFCALLATLLPATAFGQAVLTLTLDDHHDYARYAQTLAYIVTLTNSGDAAATDVPIVVALSPAWDGAGASWVCYPGSDGATCTVAGNGPLDDIATLPPGARASWVVYLPTFAATAETTATVQVGASGASPLSDTNTLVVFRDGFDVPYGDGTQALPCDIDLAAAATDACTGIAETKR